MNIYFGEIPKKYVEEGLQGFSFKNKVYDFKLTINEEHILIKDSIGRYVPFSHGDVIHLFHALKEALPYSLAFADCERIMDKLVDQSDTCI